MMQRLDTVLNISNITFQPLPDIELQKHSLLFSYLYSINSSFRELSERKQLSYLEKYRIALHKQLVTLSKKSSSKIYSKLLATDPLLLDNITDMQTNIDDILFIVFHEVLKTKYKSIIFKEDTFIFPEEYEETDQFIIYFLEDSIYHPVAIDGTFILTQDDENIRLIKLFSSQSDSDDDADDNGDAREDSDDELNSDEQNTFDETINTPDTSEQLENIILVDENNVTIYDLDDRATFIDKTINIDFSNEDFEIECVKLLNDDNSYRSLGMYSTILSSWLSDQNQSLYDHDYLMNIDLEFNSVDGENMLNAQSFLKNRSSFKSKFPWKPYNESPYIQKTQYPSLITSDTNTIVINEINNNYIDSQKDCENNISIDNLKSIAAKHNVSLKGSKKQYCKDLKSFNFILDHMISSYKNKYSLDELLSIAEENNISTTKSKSKNKLIELLIDNNALSPFCDSNTLSVDDYYEISKKHNLPHFDSLYDACQYYSHYNLLESSIQSKKSILFCHEDIQQLTTEVDEIQIPHTQNYVKILADDQLYSSGLFIKNDSTSNEIMHFNIDKYLSTFTNMSQFPIKCSIYYHFNDKNTKLENGTILSSESQLLTVKTKRKTFIYNLNDLSNNDCFIYTLLHDEYHFNKFDLFKLNIHIISQQLTTEQVRSIISVKPREYHFLHGISIQNELSIINRHLKNFNSSFFHIHHNLLSLLKEQISPIVIGDTRDTVYMSNNPPSLMPVFKSLDEEYDFNSIDDLDRIIRIRNHFNEQEYIWKYIESKFETWKKKYGDIVDAYILDTNQPSVSDLTYRTTFSSFEELVSFKARYLEYAKYKKHTSLSKTYKNLQNILTNLSSIISNNNQRVELTKVFDLLVHDKQIYATSKTADFSKKSSTHKGDIYQEDVLKHSNDNMSFVAPLPVSAKQGTGALLDVIWDLIGVKTDKKVIRYLQSKLNTYLAFMIKLLIRSHAAKLNKETTNITLSDIFKNNVEKEQLWLNYSKITIFCAYICILINTNHVYIQKKNLNYQDSICYLGYPNPEPTKNSNKKTLSHYLSSVMVFYFGQTNSNFQTIHKYAAKIDTIVKLILSYEPELSTLIDTNYQHRKTLEKPLSDDYTVDFKPQQSSEIRTFVKNNILDTNVSKTYKLTQYANNNQNELIDSTKLIRKLYNRTINHYTVRIKFPRNVTIVEKNVNPESTSNVSLSEDDLTDGQMGVQIQELIQKMTNHFKLDFDEFIKTFITTSDIIRKKYDSILTNAKLLVDVRKIISSDSITVNTIHRDLATIVTKNTYNGTLNIHKFLTSIVKIFEIVFSTTEPFTFIEYNSDYDTSTMYEKLITLVQKHIHEMTSFVKYQNISFDDLSIKKNEFRDEEQLNDRTKYSNVSDEEVYLIKSLQKLGITIDISQNTQPPADEGSTFTNVQSTDDDLEE